MNKFQNLSKEELLKLVEKQEKELASKKYGLVWDSEREPEQVVLDCANNLPVLKRVKGKEIRTDDSEDNLLIEGDNYHALTVLNYTHKEKIDVIYIDPPYNTRQEGFIYNDKRVDQNDGYRHSKWINFMEKRLRLAKNLLKNDGILFISIDDNELYQLKLLSDKIFGENNFIENFCWNKTQTPPSLSHKSRNNIDYILCYEKNKNSKKYFGKQSSNSDAPLLNKGNGIKGLDFPIGSIKFNISDGLYKKGKYGNIEILNDFFVENGINTIVVKIKGEFKWQQSNLENELNQGTYLLIKSKKMSIRYKKDNDRVNNMLPNKMIDPSFNVGTNEDASKQIKELGLNFSFPKPTSLISFLINMVRHKEKNITILDFMAGSGTTGHAILELNKEDGGNRKFILCSNNENNNGYGKIMDDVCYPRIEKVIKGYKKNGNGEKVEGLGSNLQYFKTSLIKKTKNQDQVKVNLTQRCTEMLCVKENIFNLEKNGQDYKIFFSNKKDKFLCVYYNFLDDSFNKFLKEIKKLKGKKNIYMFSVDNKVEKSLFTGVDNFTIEAIPQKILDVYKQLVKMNIPIKTDLIFLELNKAESKIFTDNEKDEGARILRIVLEKVIQKIAQNNSVNILNSKGKEEKISTLNDKLKYDKIFTHIEWEENRTYFAIGNHASHGEYDEYNLERVETFYKHIQSLLNNFGI